MGAGDPEPRSHAPGVRVLHVLEATAGGTARHLADVGCALATRGLDVWAAVSTRRGSEFRRHAALLTAAGVHLLEVPMVREISPALDLVSLWRLMRLLRSLRPDVVHTHSSKAGILGRLAAAWARTPVVVHTPHVFAFQMDVSTARRRVYLALERAVGRLTHCLVAVSHAEKDEAVRARVLPPKRIVVIENGVQAGAAVAADPVAAASVRVELGIPADAPIVLFAGRLVPQKAPEVVVDAAAHLRRSHPDAVFILAGDGPLREQLQARAERLGCRSTVRLLGHREDMPRLYAAAQVCVLPSRWEGLPYALLEAMDAGLPVVVTDIPPLREVIRPPAAGLVVSVDDPGALAERLAELLRDPERRRAMGLAGQALVRAHYTLERQIEGLAALYQGLVGAAENHETKAGAA